MTLNDPRHSLDERVVSYETLISGRPVLVAIDREAIEHYLGVANTTAEERLAFVKENLEVFTRCAGKKLRQVPDSNGVMLKRDDLPSRRSATQPGLR